MERGEGHTEGVFYNKKVKEIPVNVSVQGLTPASLLDVPKSEIFNTPL